ncbi:sulfite exporter TauE/SafE family protein [Sphingobacterium griseoflavum]|uniref:Probable membrane transporter protein n=1 Tax=Sphingobacterium griseoflavum TaxID=1474952 RepID=A0ABQ3HT42_9SPHI|nr:sulfite exporter TauE/SafE family protein [Sphingobacterium griseoflavum]GHE32016.1 UPF0721 transmembrane protein [Sphingobacterium griseoflavum]
MVTAAYVASILIGVSLGLIGGGGSMLTVPVLVYLFGLDAVSATAYSLFIVGTTSAVGSVSYFRRKLVDMKTAMLFGMPAVAAVFLTRTYILPGIPQEIFRYRSYFLTKDTLLLLLFAFLLIAAAYSMLKKEARPSEITVARSHVGWYRLLLQGFLIGTITGLIGAGGGFLLIPALVRLVKLPIKVAVGSSLVVIATNSLLGFLFSVPHLLVDWPFLLKVAAAAMVGIPIGTYLSTRLKSDRLKPAFGWMVLLVGVYILIHEIVCH